MSEYIYEEIVNEIVIDGVDCSTARIGERREKIVRCRDCEWFCEGVPKYGTASSCRLLELNINRNFFCAAGARNERREDA